MNPNAIFTAILMVIIGYAVWEAQGWDMGTRTFPTYIGSALFVLLAVQLVMSLRQPARVAAPVDEAVAREAVAARHRQRAFILWLGGFGAAVWLLSFPIGGTLATFAYLKTSGERWRTVLGISGGTAVFFWAMTSLLNIYFPPGLVLDLLPR